jgi:chromosome segregation ATPase
MKKLTKDQITRRDIAVQEIRDAADELEQAILEYNEKLSEAFGKVQAHAQEVNSAIQKARELVEEVVADIGEYMSERSEKWHNTEQGTSYQNWVDEWQGLAMNDLDFVQPEELDPDDSGEQAASDLEALPEEPE